VTNGAQDGSPGLRIATRTRASSLRLSDAGLVRLTGYRESAEASFVRGGSVRHPRQSPTGPRRTSDRPCGLVASCDFAVEQHPHSAEGAPRSRLRGWSMTLRPGRPRRTRDRSISRPPRGRSRNRRWCRSPVMNTPGLAAKNTCMPTSQGLFPATHSRQAQSPSNPVLHELPSAGPDFRTIQKSRGQKRPVVRASKSGTTRIFGKAGCPSPISHSVSLNRRSRLRGRYALRVLFSRGRQWYARSPALWRPRLR